MAAPAIHIQQLSKRYGQQPVLAGLDLTIAPGEAFGLVGVNGAGKTTCIKCLLDFCHVDGGDLQIFGVSHTDPQARGRLAFLPERFLPPYYLTGHDFLSYMARLHATPLDETRVLNLFDRLELAPGALTKPVRSYSKGMAQKLGLAACFLSGKDLLLLDEPLSGLDPKARILVKRLLLELKADGHTLFFSTHMLSDVDELCDRLGVLHGGTLRFAGTPDACREAFGAAGLEDAFLGCIAGAEPAP